MDTRKKYFPSVRYLLAELLRVLRRFPLEVLFALVGTWAAIEVSFSDEELTETFWGKLVMCCMLGLVYSLSASTWVASLRTRPFVVWLLRVLILGLAAFYIYTLPFYLRQEDIYRFFLLAAAGHVLVSVAPFWERGNINTFWYYNKTLLLRFLTAAFYSAVLFAGLSVALLALDELFGVRVEAEIYIRLWVITVGMFNTLLFLAGMPERPAGDETGGDETGETYPKALKVFTQYVLIPLVTVYVFILLTYEAKIIVQWELPRGWVSNLIIAFAVFGVLSLLLVYPIRHSSENKWINWYGRAFHWLQLPLVALLFLAIGTRIADYGFTEERFIVLITGIWLLYIALYFLSGRAGNIKMIPASLIIVILLTLTVAFPISIHSQRQRLFTIFERNDMLERGDANGPDRVIPAKKQPPVEDRREITSIVNYLSRVHGATAFSGLLDKLPGTTKGNFYARNFADTVLKSIRVDPAYSWNTATGEGEIRYFNIMVDNYSAMPVAGYDYQLEAKLYPRDAEYRAGNHVISQRLRPNEMKASLFIAPGDTLHFDLEPLFSEIMQKYTDQGGGNLELSPEDAFVEIETGDTKARFYLSSLSGRVNKEGVIDTTSTLTVIGGYLLKFKN